MTPRSNLIKHALTLLSIFALLGLVSSDVQAQGLRVGRVVQAGGGQGLRVFRTELIYPVGKSNGLGDLMRARRGYYPNVPQTTYRPAPTTYNARQVTRYGTQTNRTATGNITSRGGGRPIFTPYRPSVARQRPVTRQAPVSIYDNTTPVIATNEESNDEEKSSNAEVRDPEVENEDDSIADSEESNEPTDNSDADEK